MALELEKVMSFVDKCIYDEPAPCSNECPFKLNMRNFMKKCAKGRLSSAYKDLRTATIFPSLAIRFCPHPCLSRCQRLLLGDEPVDVGAVEEAVLRLAGHQTPDVFQIPVKETKVAVIGAGPVGLALAVIMAQKKYPVSVFDKQEGWGGHLRSDSEFSFFEEDFKMQFSTENVDFQFGKEIHSLDEVSDYSAVYIATGKNGNNFDLLSSWNDRDYSTSRRATFMGGEVAGKDMLDAIAVSGEISRLMEGAIQTGRPSGATAERFCINDCNIVPDGTEKAERVVPANPESGYDKAEVKAEASRCMLCNCNKCLTKCELMDKYKKPPKQCAMEVLADNGAHFLASRTMTREVYACNQCGYCGSICPGSVDMGALYNFSRYARVDDGIAPEAFHDFWLRELDFTTGEAFYSCMNISGKNASRVFFPGCRLSDSLPQHVKNVFDLLNTVMPTGIILGCCGAPAIWAGDRVRREKIRYQLLEIWKNNEFEIITACPSCTKMLSSILPEIKVVSLYELPEIKNQASVFHFDSAAVFDPCAARNCQEIQSAVRQIAAQSGTELQEIKDKGKCCGYGGHMRAASPKLYKTITQKRASDTDLPYIVYCANCREIFLSESKECAHVLEMMYGKESNIYNISEKHGNILNLKSYFVKNLEGKDYMPPKNEWDNIKLNISDDLRVEMENQLISDENVKECIYNSIQTGERFVNEEGVFLSSMHCRVMTYWVEYREGTEENTYTVVNTYCHRMSFDEGNIE